MEQSSSTSSSSSSSSSSIMVSYWKVQRNLRMKKAGEVVPEIEEDMIMEILLRLLPVSVLRFKCVCKSWYALITDPSFFPNHAAKFHSSRLLHPLMEPPALLLSPTPDFPAACRRHSVHTTILDQEQEQEPEPPADHSCLKLFLDHSLLAFEQKFPDRNLIDSCNGLLLYHTESGTPNQYTVFNPITNQYKEVPLRNLLLKTFIKPNEEELAAKKKKKKKKKPMVFDHPHIVFDPSISLSYKLLAVMRPPFSTHFQFYVYSESNHTGGSFKRLASVPNIWGTLWNTFMFNGVFYWLCHPYSICYDFVEETVSLLPIPLVPAECPNCDVLYFGEFGGRIRLIREYCDRNGHPPFACSFDIMEMELGSTIWTMKARVNLQVDQETSGLFDLVIVRVMHLYKTDKGEEVALLILDYESVISFNITTETVGNELTIPYNEHLDCLNAFPFTPTLYPL